MRILIAESKTMEECAAPVESAMLAEHRPALDRVATALMHGWSQWSPADIAQALKISPALAARFVRMAYEFPNKTTGGKAIEAYTGVVFKAFGYGRLDPELQMRADRTIDIISSLYGWLRADDIVKPYRLDFTPRMAPDGSSMANYWKPLITPLLIDSMLGVAEEELLDLMPADAASCLDWKALRRHVRVVKVEFRSVADGGKLKTPHSTLLKTLRGQLLREIIVCNIRTASQLVSFECDKMYAAPGSDPHSGSITMLCSV